MQNNMIRLLRQVTIKKRLFITLVFSILLPAVLITVYSGYLANKSISKEIIKYAKKYNDVLSNDVNRYLQSFGDLADQMIYSEEMQDIIIKYKYMDSLEKAEIKLSYGKRVMAIFSQLEVVDIRAIHTNNDTIFSRGFFYLSEKEIREIIEDKEDVSNGGEISVFEKNEKKYLVIVKPIKRFTAKQADGFFMLLLDNKVLNRFVNIEELGEGAKVYVLDQYDNPMNEADMEYLSQLPLDEFKAKTLGENREYYSTQKIGADQMFITYKNFKNFKICTLIPDNTIKKTGILLWRNMIIMSSVFVVLAFFLANIISKSIIRPVYQVKDYIEDSITFHFTKTYADDGKDEIAYIGKIFTQIVEQIKFMIEQISRDEREKREMEINMLQAQINPHFLFNTLNTLRFIAMANGMENISQGIFALCEILKNTIIDHNSMVTIEEELANIRNYVTIQRLRYEDSFHVEYQIDENVKDLKILKFILQPIIENSILHGLNEEGRKTKILLDIRERGDSVLIQIMDDGKGFQMQQDIQAKGKKLSGIGLSNVKDRIMLNYGEKGSFFITSKEGFYTKVEMVMPKQR